MERKIFDTILKWKSSPDRALLLKGPCQVGKTYLMKELAKSYVNSVYIDLENQKELRDIFTDNEAREIYERLSFRGYVFDKPGGRTLFAIDGIQSCPRAYSALKSLVIDGRCDIIASYSFFGIMPKGGLSPMGYVQIESVRPMDFEEFLWATGIGKENTGMIRQRINSGAEVEGQLSQAIADRFRKFMVVGGMPAAVRIYAETHDYVQVRKVLASICRSVKKAISGHLGGVEGRKVLACLESVPSQLSRKNKVFAYCDVESVRGAGRREYGAALELLSTSGVTEVCHNLEDLGGEILLHKRADSFKIYLMDVGILTYLLGAASQLDSGDIYVGEGAILENCIALALISNGFRIGFYNRPGSEMRVDFIFHYRGMLTAMEVRAGKRRKSKSLAVLMSNAYPVVQGIRICEGMTGTDEDGVHYLPLFAPCFFDPPALRYSPLEDPGKVSEMIRRA